MLNALIVEDEAITRDVLRNYIPWNKLGISGIEEAEDGQKAMEIIQNWKPDIILTDIKMPRVNGIEFASAIREKYPDCKIIFLSSYSDKEYMKSAIKLKAVNYIEKPINLDEIAEVLTNAISEYNREKQDKDYRDKYLMDYLCLELTKSSMDMESIYPEIKKINLSFTEGGEYVCVIIRHIPQSIEDTEESITYKTNIEHELEMVFDKLKYKYIMGQRGDDFILFFLYNCLYNENMNILSLLGAFLKNAKEHYGDTNRFLIAIGQNIIGLKNIHLTYQTAVTTLHRQFYALCDNSIALYKEDNGKSYIFNENNYSLIADYLKQEKKNEVISLIKRITGEIKKYRNTQPEYVKSIFFEIILIISKFAENRNVQLLKEECSYILDLVSKANTLNEIETNIIDLITSIMANMQSDCTNGDISIKITRYIQDNFSCENLSINSIAESLYLTPTYICALFKKSTGKTINQYVTEVRMEKAKEYLKIGNSKLNDVARKVGYVDGKYFSKVFDKLVGMKPREYREIHRYEFKNV